MTGLLTASRRLRMANIRRHVHAINGSERVAQKNARIGSDAWDQLLGIMGAGSRGYAQDQFRLRQVLYGMLDNLLVNTRQGLFQVGKASWEQSVDAWLRSVPRASWLKLLERKFPVTERVFEREFGGKVGPAEIELPKGVTRVGNRIEFSRDLPESAFKKLLKQFIFEAPDETRVTQILTDPALFPDRATWPQKLASEGLSFDSIVGQVATGMSQGEGVGDIARRVLPLVDNVRSRAVRIARTEGLRVADQVQRETWKPTRSLRVGLQIIATLDEFTRPHHRARHATVYWEPEYAPLAAPLVDECPETPDEPNCRCLVIVLLDPADAAANVAMAN